MHYLNFKKLYNEPHLKNKLYWILKVKPTMKNFIEKKILKRELKAK
jgi:hypothetical protein